MTDKQYITRRVVAEALADGEWHSALTIAGRLRKLVTPQQAMRRYRHWLNPKKADEMSVADQVDRGRKCVVFTRLSVFKREGYLEADAGRGNERHYRLIDKGRQILGGNNGNGKAE